ncbi:hypothetical protein EKK58_01735 [Candidatus Dependentiae bacterium]|nr:MAG: hypothetical protein EKK58_01735 [Candidatus Dependentiae bacterium]
MESEYIEYVRVPSEKSLRLVLPKTLLYKYVNDVDLKELYSFAGHDVNAACLFKIMQQFYSQFRIKQLSTDMRSFGDVRYIGCIVSEEYHFLVKALLDKQAPKFWHFIENELNEEIVLQHNDALILNKSCYCYVNNSFNIMNQEIFFH